MAKKKTEPVDTTSTIEGTKGRFQVTIDPVLEKKLKIIAAALDISPPTYVNSRLMTIIESEYREVVKRLGAEE